MFQKSISKHKKAYEYNLNNKVAYKNRVLRGDIMSSISNNEYKDRKLNLNLTELAYNKTFEEEMEEKRKVSIAEGYLEGLGVKVRTDMYGYYRNTYDILLDLGEYLDGKKEYNYSLLAACKKYFGDE